MHIVYLHPHFTYPGGAGLFVLETAKRLGTQGANVTIITQKVTPEILNNYPKLKFIEIGGPLPNCLFYWFLFFNIYKKVEQIIDEINPDIIFPQVFPSNYWGFLYKRHNPNIHCIWYCHEPSAFVHNNLVINGLPFLMKSMAIITNPLMKRIDKILVNNADAVFVNSDYTALKCKEIYNLNYTKKIYPGIDIDEFPPFPPDKENYFLCVSRLTKFKSIDMVIRSIKILQNRQIFIKLIIIGDGEEKESLIKMVHELGLSDNIIFSGKISRSELISFYSKAIAVIFPSTNEPFGIVPIESQAAWTPVISTKSGGPLESIVDGKSGFLITSGSENELIDKITFLFENIAVAKEMGIYGHNYITKNFLWNKTSHLMLMFFKQHIHSNKKLN